MLTLLDIVILSILGLSALVGVLRGMIAELMGLVVWFAAAYLSFKFGADLAPLYADVVNSESIQQALGYFSLFVGTLLVGSLITYLLRKLVSSTGLSGTDRMLGVVFGLVRGVAIACVVILLLSFTPFTKQAWWGDSMLLPHFRPAAQWMQTWLPSKIASSFNVDGEQAQKAASTVDAAKKAYEWQKKLNPPKQPEAENNQATDLAPEVSPEPEPNPPKEP